MKKIGIMQPYFLPYVGYFQLMNLVDEFVVYDNIQFTKKGWIHRNRMLQNGKDEYFSLPLRKDSDYLNVNQRFLADSFAQEKTKMLNKIQNNYRKAPFLDSIWPLVQEIFNHPENNLFDFIYHALVRIKTFLEIDTPLIISSEIPIDHQLKGKEKVMEIVKARQGKAYINPIGGVELYDKNEFAEQGIELSFLKAHNIAYEQFKNDFVPFLSILDVLMFNEPTAIKDYLNEYSLL